MKLDTLYKISSTGATQVLNMEITSAVYTRTWGQLNGKMQTKATTAKGKNIGKSNETTPEQQAIMEAEAVWVKKQKANYSTSTEAPVTVKLPMKVNTYQDHVNKIIFPCMTSVKLNGVNAEYRLVNEVLKLYSRGGEEYPIPPHQKEQVMILLEALHTDSINGEMYIHKEFLQDIMGATKKPKDLSTRLKFWVFDFPNLKGDYQTRCSTAYAKAQTVSTKTPDLPLINVGVAHSHRELDAQHEIATDAGYEGIIIRNVKGLYAYNTRSLDVFKYKIAQDAEFQAISFELDKNGHTVFTCITGTPNGDETFKVKLKGTNEERLVMAAKAATYIGKWLNVEFEELSKDGIPLKPVGQYFRKVGANGEAIE